MSWKETKQQINAISAVPKINSVRVVQAKKSEDGIKMRSYHLADKTDTLSNEVIKGVFVGYYFKHECYYSPFNCSTNTTAYFYKTDKVKIYCTDRQSDLNQHIRYFKGNADEAKALMGSLVEQSGDKTKTFAIVIIATENGVVEVKTNPLLFLSQLGSFEPHSTDYFIEVSPMLWSPSLEMKKLPDLYEKLPEDRYPLFCSIVLTNSKITPIHDKTCDLDKVFNDFKEFKEFTKKEGGYTIQDDAVPYVTPARKLPTTPTPKPETPDFPKPIEGDDLPF